jgi:hypothetical protein
MLDGTSRHARRIQVLLALTIPTTKKGLKGGLLFRTRIWTRKKATQEEGLEGWASIPDEDMDEEESHTGWQLEGSLSHLGSPTEDAEYSNHYTQYRNLYTNDEGDIERTDAEATGSLTGGTTTPTLFTNVPDGGYDDGASGTPWLEPPEEAASKDSESLCSSESGITHDDDSPPGYNDLFSHRQFLLPPEIEIASPIPTTDIPFNLANYPSSSYSSSSGSSTSSSEINYETDGCDDDSVLPVDMYIHDGTLETNVYENRRSKPLNASEESLVCTMRRSCLAAHLYGTVAEWGEFSHEESNKKELLRNSEHPGGKWIGIRSFKTVVRKMLRKYQASIGQPPMAVEVSVPGWRDVYVRLYRYDYLDCLRLLLADQDMMEGSVWGYDRRFCSTPSGQTRVYSELHTGDWWKRTEDFYVNESPAKSHAKWNHVHRHVLIVPIMGDDETFCDHMGKLTANPYITSIGNIPVEKRSSPKAWRLLGMIPKYPKSTTEDQDEKKKMITKSNHLQFLHECLDVLLKSVFDLIQADQNIYGYELDVAGVGTVMAHFAIPFIIGDTKGHNDMCCHFSVRRWGGFLVRRWGGNI